MADTSAAVVATPEPPTTDEPSAFHLLIADVIFIIAAYLDIHDLQFGLGLVNKLCYAVANDDSVWGQIVVCPCTVAELIHLAKKHPSIHRVSCAYIRNLSGVEEAWQYLPCIERVLSTDLTASLNVLTGRQLTHIDSCAGALPFAIASGAALTEFVCKTKLSPDEFTALAAACPNLTKFATSSDSILANATAATAFPKLTSFTYNVPFASVDGWTGFVESHPNLLVLNFRAILKPQGMSLDGVVDVSTADAEDAAVDLDTVPMFENLKELYALDCPDADLTAKLLESNPRLIRVSISTFTAAIIDALLYKDYLVALTSVESRHVTPEQLNVLADAQKDKFRYFNVYYISTPHTLAVAHIMGNVTSLEGCVVNSAVLDGLRSRLIHLRRLVCGDDLSKLSCEILGQHALRLDNVLFSGAIQGPEELAPALTNVTACRMRASPGMESVTATLGQSCRSLTFVQDKLKIDASSVCAFLDNAVPKRMNILELPKVAYAVRESLYGLAERGGSVMKLVIGTMYDESGSMESDYNGVLGDIHAKLSVHGRV